MDAEDLAGLLAVLIEQNDGMITVSRSAVENTLWDGRVVMIRPSQDGESLHLTLERIEDINADLED